METYLIMGKFTEKGVTNIKQTPEQDFTLTAK